MKSGVLTLGRIRRGNALNVKVISNRQIDTIGYVATNVAKYTTVKPQTRRLTGRLGVWFNVRIGG